ncbi:MAG: aromatic acid exporter family protein [Actinomycetota bacterium]|nr:aromatic acid exporter family protein [Actinomycetota bacterium]
MVRLTAAAVASFVVASLMFPHSEPLLAPLTALLVVQLTPVSILASGIQRVASVVAGVSVAVGLSSLVGITWWSLGTVIALSILIGQVLRLGPNLLEVPISAMLVLGVGARTAETAAWQRIAETLVGAGVGVLSNLLFPPKVTSEDAASAIEGLGADLARLLDSAAQDVGGHELSTGELGERARRWLDEARRLTHDIPNVGSALLRAEESRRLNLRALGTADSGPGLRQGLEALEHSAVALRGMFRSFVEASQGYDSEGRELPQDVRAAVSLLLHDLAAATRSFGGLVHAEAHPGDDPPELAELRDALQSLQDARARVTDLLLIDPRGDTALAVLTLSLLSTVERLLQELDLDERTRRHVRRQPTLPQRLVTHPRRPEGGPAKRTWRKRRHGGNQL